MDFSLSVSPERGGSSAVLETQGVATEEKQGRASGGCRVLAETVHLVLISSSGHRRKGTD